MPFAVLPPPVQEHRHAPAQALQVWSEVTGITLGP